MNLFKIVSEPMDGIKVIESTVFPDNRGSFLVTFLQDEFAELGLPPFVRQMRTHSESGVLRGLHFQTDPPMGKLIEVVKGDVFLVAVDVRPDSPTFLQSHTMCLTERERVMVWADAGFARGYFAYENSIVQYSTDAYVGEEQAVAWDDSDIGILWPTATPILSKKDQQAPTAGMLWRQD